MAPFSFRRHADLTPAFGEAGEPYAFGIDELGRVFVVTNRSVRPTSDMRGVHVFHDGNHWSLPVEAPHGTLFVQPTTNGLLLVAPFVDERDLPGTNAVRCDWNGNAQSRFSLGDDVVHVRTTRGGRIWVGYGDVGIGRCRARRGRSEVERAVASGCACFDEDGGLLHTFDAPSGVPDIWDVYAMNVDGENSVWLHYHTDFPLVHWGNGGAQAWSTTMRYAHAIAVRGDRICLYRGPRTAAEAFREGERPALIQDWRLHPQGETELIGEDEIFDTQGEPFTPDSAVGVGSRLYLRRGREIWVRDLDDE